MPSNSLSTGKNPPKEVNAIIENPFGTSLIKYEMDKKSGRMVVDRFLQAAMYYPGNYGFIPNTLSEDGDPVDILVVEKTKVAPGSILPAVPIGVLYMEDENGVDEKIIAVPPDRLLPEYKGVKSYKDLPKVVCQKIEHFFRHYKDLDDGKWSKLNGWGDAQAARDLIKAGIDREAKARKSGSKPSGNRPSGPKKD
jgi:inorganic pyrophosphatase